MTPPTMHRTPRRVVRLALAGCAGVALAVPTATPAHAQGPSTPAASAPSTTYTAPASASASYANHGVHATVKFTRLADTAYKVTISGTTNSAAPTVLPVQFTSGLMVPTGTYPMRSGHGAMNLAQTSATFTFARSYLNAYEAPFTFSGEWTVIVTTAQTSTQSITVGGHAYTIGVHAPAANGQADGAGRRIMVRRAFEVENTTLRTAAAERRYFAADNDGGLNYGELKDLYTTRAFRGAFSQQYRFETVVVPKDASKAEVNAAINHGLPRGWAPITTNARQNPTGRAPIVVTTANEIQTSKGARPAPGGAAWGPHHNIPELYWGSSTQRHI